MLLHSCQGNMSWENTHLGKMIREKGWYESTPLPSAGCSDSPSRYIRWSWACLFYKNIILLIFGHTSSWGIIPIIPSLEFQRQNDNLLLIIYIIIYYNLLVLSPHTNAQMISLESIPHRDCHPAGPCSNPCQCYLHGLTLWKSLQFLGNPFPSERLSWKTVSKFCL